MAASAAAFLSPFPPSNSLPRHRFLPAFLSTLSTPAAATNTMPTPSSSRYFHSPPRFRYLAEGGGDAFHSLPTEKPWAHSGGSVWASTAPWMKGPLVLPPEDVLDLSRPPAGRKGNGKRRGGPLTEKVRGGRSRQAMKKIVQSIVRLGERTSLDEDEEDGVVGDLLEFPLEQVLGSSREEEVLREAAQNGEMPWVSIEKPPVFPRAKKQRVVTAAELVLPDELLTRLRMEARRLTKWVKAKKAGVTDDVVNEIRATWRRDKLAMVKFVEPLCCNMDRAREIVEVSDWILSQHTVLKDDDI